MKPKTKLVDMVKIKMSKRQVNAIKRIDAEPCDVIVLLTSRELRRRGEKHSKAFYEAGCLALKQYYATTIFDPVNMHAISDNLDTFWHAHVLDTVAYDLLCKDIKGFMHHDPLNKFDTAKMAAVKKIYDYTRVVLERIFGAENLDERFHPSKSSPSILVCRHDVDKIGRRSLSTRDAFPVNPEMQKLRAKYSHEAVRKATINAVRRALA